MEMHFHFCDLFYRYIYNSNIYNWNYIFCQVKLKYFMCQTKLQEDL